MPTLLITGTNRGIGLELCRQYLAQDWEVYATCRDPDNAQALKELALTSPANNKNLHIHPLDVTNEQQMDTLKTVLNGKPIDILLNNTFYLVVSGGCFGSSRSSDY